MNLIFLGPKDIDEHYPKLFQDWFGKENIIQSPSVVAVAEDSGKEVAFIAGYWTNKIEFYVQYCAINPEVRGSGDGTRYLNQALKEVGAMFYTTMIPGDNYPAMKVVMNCGFRLFGSRQSTDGCVLGEWIKDMRQSSAPIGIE